MPTMREIAERAGVSYTTVSYVLNDRKTPRPIGQETRDRVLRIAGEMGYQRNELARAVVTGKSAMLGFLARAPQDDLEYIARVLTGVIEEASEQGYLVKALYLSADAPRGEAIARCIAWRLTGVVTMGLGPEATGEFNRGFAPHRIALATIEDSETDGPEIPIRSDEEGGMRSALEHLVGLGHRRIAYLAAAAAEPIAQRRAERFRRLCAEFLKDADAPVVWGDWWDIAANRDAMLPLLTLPAPRRPTALLCSGDPAAMVALSTARALGLSVPRDLSVIGYGDYTMALYADPPLTTITQPFREMGRAAVRRLLEAGSAPSPESPVVLPTQLTVRGSATPPAAE
jgi:LacI family transcriptional regulator